MFSFLNLMYTVFSKKKKKKVHYCNMSKTCLRGPYVSKPLISLLPFQSIALSPASCLKKVDTSHPFVGDKVTEFGL